MNLSSLLNRAGQRQDAAGINQVFQNQLLWMLLLRVVLYTLLLIISFIFQDSRFDIIVVPPSLLFIFIFLIYLSTIFSAFFLLTFQPDLRKFGFSQTLLDTCFVSILVFFSGTSNSNFTTVYFFPIVAGGLILPRKGGLVAAASASLQYGVLLLLELYGIFPPYLLEYLIFSPSNQMVSLNQFAVHGLTFFLAASLSALFGLRLQKAETALSDSIKKFDRLAILYKQIFDNISTGIITVDSQGEITSANNAIENITGHNPSSIVDRKLLQVFPGINLTNKNLRNTTDFTKENGSEVRIGYSHMIIERPEEDSRSSEPPHKIITLQDISEIEKLERQVRQTEKLAAIGMMSASIAHDFRNPLTAISGSAQVLANEFSSESDTNHINFELANIILRESNRLNITIGEFLKFSRPELVSCDWFSLKSCLDEVLQVLHAGTDFPETVDLCFDFDRKIDVWGDEKQMFTVLSHLIQNSIPFCPQGKEQINIGARDIHIDGLEMLQISISDNGTGIDEPEPDTIFEPFYTNRADGTGLGLAIVRQIIGEHHGTISVVNNGLKNHQDGKGAHFVIHLPMPDQ